MTHFEIKSNWTIIKAKLKQKWDYLTEDDLECPEDQHEQLIERLQQRTGAPREAIEATLREETLRNSSESMYRRFLSRNWLGA